MLAPIVPIAALVVAGIVFARRKIIASTDSRAFTEFAFRVAIPAYLFGNLLTSDLKALFDVSALSVYIVTALVAAAAVAAWARFVHGHAASGIALRIMAAIQVNTAYVAIPVLIFTFGTAAPIFPILLFQVLVLTVVVIAILEAGTHYSTQDTSPLRRLTVSIRRSLTTPVVVACVAGIGFNAVHAPIPEVVAETLSFAGAAASPVAVFALGLHLGGNGIRWRGASPDENALVIIKSVAFPSAMWAATALAGIPDPWRGYLILIAAMPAPQNLFTFAQSYDTDVDLAASVVLKSTALSLCLLPLWQLAIR